MAMPILPKFLTLNWNISRTIWRIEVGDSSFFSIFHALSFEGNLLIFDRSCPLTILTGSENNHKIKYLKLCSGQLAVGMHPLDCKYTILSIISENADRIDNLHGKGGRGASVVKELARVKQASHYY